MSFIFSLGLFAAKVGIIILGIIIVLVAMVVLFSRDKKKSRGKLTVNNLTKKLVDLNHTLMEETATPINLKTFLKQQKTNTKQLKKLALEPHKVFVLNFQGDIKASATSALSQEINAILSIATPKDEVILRLESAGGMVHGYGLAAAQLMRLRDKKIPLTITIDKVAASGGYMMAAIADTIVAAPFAIIGSIGVVVQLPNFHRLLKNNKIDFEQHTAGEFKRTVTVFGENTKEGKEKLQAEIENIHEHFKALISHYRPKLDIEAVSTGEHWLGQEALSLRLVDEIKTSDALLLEKNKHATLYEIKYETKKTFLGKLSSASTYLRSFFQHL